MLLPAVEHINNEKNNSLLHIIPTRFKKGNVKYQFPATKDTVTAVSTDKRTYTANKA